MHQAAKSFLRNIGASNPERTAAKREYHEVKWNAVAPFFRAVDVDIVDMPMLKRFMRWERLDRVKPITLRKYFVTLRQILRFAVEEGWAPALPMFPAVGKVESNPRPWFEPDEWKLLQEEAEERIECAKEEPGKHRHPRMDLLDFMRLMVATRMRVDELRSVKVKNVQVVTRVDEQMQAWQREEARPTRKEEGIKRHSRSRDAIDAAFTAYVPTREYLEIALQHGKTGARTVLTRLSDSGVETFRALVKRKTQKADDLLFSEHHRDAFRELLIATNLRTDGNGRVRNLRSLRQTGMMLCILDYPNANIKMLAASWGTSMEMISHFYVKRLDVKLNRHAIVG